MLPVLVTVNACSERLPLKSVLLLPYTLQYLLDTGRKDVTYVVGDDEVFEHIANKHGVKYIDKRTLPGYPFEHWQEQVAAAESINAEKYILAQVTQPYKESWLIDAVEEITIRTTLQVGTVHLRATTTWREVPANQIIKRQPDHKHIVDGCLFGYTTAQVKEKQSHQLIEHCVTHNPQAWLDVDNFYDLPSPPVLERQRQDVFFMSAPRATGVTPCRAYVLGQSIHLGDPEPFAADDTVVIVNWLKFNPQLFKNLDTVHLFSPHAQCITDAKKQLRDVNANIQFNIISTRGVERGRKVRGPDGQFPIMHQYTEHSPQAYTEWIRKFNQQYVPGTMFSSSGTDALMWLLSKGYRDIHAYGFGQLGAKKIDANGRHDQRPEWEVEDHLKRILISQKYLTLCAPSVQS